MMRFTQTARLRLRVIWELLRYDAMSKTFGFRALRARMGNARNVAAGRAEMETVLEAIGCMSSFYWKPLLCLQRSIVTARVLRANGVAAEVVVGYRPSPFFSHAWVEVAGQVVNDSSGYPKKLQTLDRF
jgi:hypothetical protein